LSIIHRQEQLPLVLRKLKTFEDKKQKLKAQPKNTQSQKESMEEETLLAKRGKQPQKKKKQ